LSLANHDPVPDWQSQAVRNHLKLNGSRDLYIDKLIEAYAEKSGLEG
jgi:hypothetical protein